MLFTWDLAKNNLQIGVLLSQPYPRTAEGDRIFLLRKEFLSSLVPEGAKFHPKIAPGFFMSMTATFNVWTAPVHIADNVIHELFRISGERIPSADKDMLEALKKSGETDFVRSSLDMSLLRSQPKGDYQLKGIRFILSRNRGMLAWEMGLGKTFTILSALNHYWVKEKIDRILVVASAESVYNFREEILMFGPLDIHEHDIYVANVIRRTPLENDPRIIICSYRTFLMIQDDAFKLKNKKRMTAKSRPRAPLLDFESWGTTRALILDESHMVKNRLARQSKAINLHKEAFYYRYLLTGTPAPRAVEDYYFQVHLMDPSAIGKPYFDFLADIAVLGNNFSEYGIHHYIPEGVSEFEKKIRPWVSRELTEGNLDLPELLIRPLFVDWRPEQKDIYKELVNYTLGIVKEDNHGQLIPKKVQNKFPFILQALENPDMLKGKIDKNRSNYLYNLVKKWKFKNNAKLEILDSLLRKYVKEEKRKVIVWSGHPSTLDSLTEFYSKYKSITLHGGTPTNPGQSRDELKFDVVKEFSDDKSYQVMFASYFVLKSAVNITAATRAIYFDLPLDYGLFIQTVKRIHRIGQDQDTLIDVLVFPRSLESRNFRKLQDEKAIVNEGLFNTSHSFSVDQWRNIFAGMGDD